MFLKVNLRNFSMASVLYFLLQLIICHAAVSSHTVEMIPNKPRFRIGDRQELTCRVKKCPGTVKFSWSNVEDKPLYGEIKTFTQNESTLVFKDVQKRIENRVLCNALCGKKLKQAKAEIIVYSFPNAPVVFGHDSLVLGRENTLTCNVSDVYPAESMTVEWLRGGKVVKTQEKEYGIKTIQSSYTFKPHCNDTGESIICRATLDLSDLPQEERTRETTVSMTVFSFPSDPTIEISGPFLEGNVTNLTCTVHDIFPVDRFHIQWMYGERELQSVRGNFSDKLQNLSLTMSIKPKGSDQNKTFTCKVSLKIGDQLIQKIASTTLEVHYSPKNTIIDVKPKHQLIEGQSVNISCQTNSSPEGYVTLSRVWNGEKTKLVSHNGTQISFSISSANVSHSGIYVCEAVNRYGNQTKEAQVTVHAPPRNISVTVYPSDEVQEGENITVCCQLVSFPPSKIALRKLDNENIIYSADGIFLLVNLTASNSGMYQITADNGLGFQNKNFTINVLRKENPSIDTESSVLKRINSIDFVAPVISVGVLATVISTLEGIRRAKRKGFYEMTEGIP